MCVRVYSIIDLSSVDEVAYRWNNKAFKNRDKGSGAQKAEERSYRAEENLLRAV